MNLLGFQQPLEEGPDTSETFEGVIAENAVANVPVRVIIPEFDSELAHGPCPWTPVVTAAGIFYPHVGERCVVVEPLSGDPWIAGWTPGARAADAVITGSGDKHHFHHQSVAKHTWTINHSLGKIPTVAYFDSDAPPKRIFPDDETHPSDNQTVATFRVGGVLTETGGKAVAN